MISTMPKGSIVVDVSVDQGLGTESLKKPTTLKKPYVIVDDVIHIAIENIASLYPITMSQFFSSVVTEHIIKSKGDFANYIDKEIKKSLQTKDGKIFNKKISDSLNLKFK
jgi:alanine dehydrogenase